MKKILILYAKYGGGHLSAANAIEKYIKNHYSDTAEVKNVDCIEYVNKFVNKVSTDTYVYLVKKKPKLWKKLYYGSRKGFLSLVSARSSNLMAKRLSRLFKEYSPDIVIAVQPFASQISGIIKKRKKFNFKLAVVLTDFATHPQWLVEKDYCDYFFVSNSDMKDDLVNRYLIPSEKIFVVGIPLSESFSIPMNDEEILNKYNLNKDKKVILFFGGGEFGIGPTITIKVLHTLVKHLDTYQIIAISGKNKKMYEKFSKIANEINNKDLHVMDYSTEVAALMHISSLVITKPGGLTSSESLASHLPIIIVNPIPGQEEENADFLVKAGAGIWLKGTDNVDEIICNLLCDEKQLNFMKEKAVEIAKPNSTRDICNILLG